jgi:hypothetical protein
MTKSHIKITNYTIIIFFVSILISGCSKFIEVSPPITSTNGEIVFQDDATAIAVLTGIYTNLSNSSVSDLSGTITNIFFSTGLTGDELKVWDESDFTYEPFFTNNLSSSGPSNWSNIYKMIFVCNSALEQLPAAVDLTPQIKSQLEGEASFIRALSYFYLINLYGDVPLVLTTNYKINSLLARSQTNIVYDQIISDLKRAENLLSENYTGGDGISATTERVRPNKWTATALLARVYLYTENYIEAESRSTSLISNTNLYNLVDLNSVFLMNNKEAIWQLQPVGIASNYTANTKEGYILKITAEGPSSSNPVYLTNTLVNSFDDQDQRKKNWIDTNIVTDVETGDTIGIYPYAFKYKKGRDDEATSEYSTVFRLGEQYLIRAEARIQQGKIQDGIADLNVIRTRATNLSDPVEHQLTQLPSNLSKEEALSAVENERKFELFTEWGHRWFDIKRTNRIDAIMKNTKPNWQATDKLFPLPKGEVTDNPSIRGHQNPGYN